MNFLVKSIRYIGIFLLIVIFVAGPLAVIRYLQVRAMMAAGANPPVQIETVTAAPVKEENWENSVAASGTLAAVQGVTVGAEVAGKIVKISFEAGAVVKAGDILVELDTTTEGAQLRASQATAALAKANLTRAHDLRQSNTNSPAELDAADAQAKQASAQAEGLQAVIDKKTIRAPFSGRLGLRLVNLGQVLKEGDPITSLQTLDPIYVNFSLPQQRLPQVAPGNAVRVKTDAAPGEVFEGKINAISPEVDPVTRNIRVQATISNKTEKLRGGMFASVELVLPTRRNVLVLPATAVLYAPYGDTVFVVDEKKNEKTGAVEKVLRQQFVRLGGTQGDFVIVVEGLKAGEMVVTSGVFKLRKDMVVVIDNNLAPKAELKPKPHDA